MNLSDIMRACARARALTATASERQGVDRAAASILDAFAVPAIGSDRARFLRLSKGSVA
jgi:hypothetical protein